MNRALRTGAWTAGLAGALAILGALGDRLPAPPLLDAGAAWSWLDRSDPALATFAIVRLVAAAVVAYLLLATIALLVADATTVPVLELVATRLTLPSARRLIRHAAGAGLALTLAGTAAPVVAGAAPPHPHAAMARPVSTDPVAEPPEPEPTTPDAEPPEPERPRTGADPSTTDPMPVLQAVPDDLTMVHLGPSPDRPDPAAPPATASDPTNPDRPAAPQPEAPVMTAVEQAPATDTPAAPAPEPAPAAPAADPVAGAEDPAAGPDRPAPSAEAGSPADEPGGGARADDDRPTPYTIVTGDHLWGVSERTLAGAWKATPDPDEIARYLQLVIATNRSVLAVPDDPDLVFPGQVFTLPPVEQRAP